MYIKPNAAAIAITTVSRVSIGSDFDFMRRGLVGLEIGFDQGINPFLTPHMINSVEFRQPVFFSMFLR